MAWSMAGGTCADHRNSEAVFVLIHCYPDDRVLNGKRITKFTGYSQVKDYYNIDYNNKTILPGDVDYRRTLYWNPKIKTDKDGKASVRLYNNSIGRKIVIDCQGMTVDGECIFNQ